MRWMYCAQPPDPEHPLRLRARRGGQAKAPDRLELRLVPRHLRDDRGLRAALRGSRPAGPPEVELRPLDRWLLARTQAFLAEASASYEGFLTVGVVRALESFVDDLSNWYIRRSRRRFWEDDDEAAFRTLWYGLVQALRAFSPIMPFLDRAPVAEPRRRACEGAPDERVSRRLARAERDARGRDARSRRSRQVRQVVELGRRARARTQGSSTASRCRQAHRARAPRGRRTHVDEIREELRVKDVGFDTDRGSRRCALKPNLPVLGPKLGQELPERP